MSRRSPDITRRRFIGGAAHAAVAGALTRNALAAVRLSSPESLPGRIRAIEVGTPNIVPDNFGDTWAIAWADDDHLYSPSNDTLGFGIPAFLDEQLIKLFQTDLKKFAARLSSDQKEAVHMAPLTFNRLEGNDPMSLRGVTVNRMREYTEQDGFQTIPYEGVLKGAPDGRTWKSSGCTFVDGALYWAIARHLYPKNKKERGIRQNAANASLLRSVDYGKTWTRSADENMKSAMFPGSRFATPYLIDYGRRNPNVDGSADHIYAISNNGYWDNGDSLTLGRVPREYIGRLRGADWEFYRGGDGLRSASWTRDVTAARSILEAPGRLGETGAVYLPARERYMLVGWYYTAGSGYLEGGSTETMWDFYEAPKPWGPWTLVYSHKWKPQGYYCPTICPKFQTDERIYVLTAGDFRNWWEHYRLTVIPVYQS